MSASFKWLFDRIAAFLGLVCLCWLFPIVALLIKVKMPGPVLFVQKRVGRDGKLFDCHKFRTMTVGHGGSSVSVAGEARITPLGAKLRHYKIDELPELWDVFIGNMSFVGPRPDVPGYADTLEGEAREVLRLRPGITGPATLKYRDEEEMIAGFVAAARSLDSGAFASRYGVSLPSAWSQMSDEQLAVWYNDTVIYPDKVRLNLYYLHHYSFLADLKMIFVTVLGKRMEYAGEVV